VALAPIRALIETIREVEGARTAWQAARAAAVAITNALRARAVIIHQHDLRTGELRIIGVDGPDGEELLGTSAPAGEDVVVRAAVSTRKPMVVRLDPKTPCPLPHRIAVVGVTRTVIAVPAVGARGCAAVIEIVDAEARREANLMDVCALVIEPLLRAL
jgi:hypothetical protein